MTEKSGIIKSKATYSDDKKHRFILERVWDNDSSKNMVSVILFNPSYANELVYDYTTMKVINYLIEKDQYRGVFILNLYSVIETNSNLISKSLKSEKKDENNIYIKECVKKSSKVYKAWGSNKDNKRRIKEIIKILEIQFKSIYELVDKNNNAIHPSRCSIYGEKQVELENVLK